MAKCRIFVESRNKSIYRQYLYVDIKHALIGCIFWAVFLIVWIIAFQLGWRTIPFFNYLNIVSSEGIAWQ